MRGARAPPHPMCCRSSGRRGRVSRPGHPRGHRDPRATREGREAEARVQAAEEHPSPGPARSSHPGRRAPRAPASPAQHVAVRVRPRARSRPGRPQSPLPAHAPPGTDAHPARTGSRGRSLGAGAGRGARATRGAGAGARAFTCAGQGPGGGEGQERQQQPHSAREPGVARRGGRRGCCDPKGRGFIAEPRRDAGSGSSPWRGLPSPCPETTNPHPTPTLLHAGAPQPTTCPLLSEEHPHSLPPPTPPHTVSGLGTG